MSRIHPDIKAIRSAAGTVRPRGFTLLELLVASAAVVIIALGLAQVFRVTGETVASGKRLSAMTTYAATIERQLRADFAALTRDGFMIIRHEGVDADGDGQFTLGTLTSPGPDAVLLNAADQNPRSRRIDELVFFTKGNYRSARDPRHPGITARANEARVYYGHAQRRTEPANFNPLVIGTPQNPLDLSDANSITPGTALGQGVRLGELRPGNPNAYAADWALVRHVALLASPSGVEQDTLLAQGPLPRSLASVLTAQSFRDSDYQVGLQPAAPSIFRRLNDIAFLPSPLDVARPALGSAGQLEVPYFSSGLVDIATTSLSEVRSIVLGLRRPSELTQVGQAIRLEKFLAGDPAVPPTGSTQTFTDTMRMQQWMAQAFPADGDGIGNGGLRDLALARRIRAELTPPNFLGFPTPQVQQDYERADQLMLTTSVLVPHCSEFIVEWSFGEVDAIAGSPTEGRTVWYGLERLIDVAQDGQLPSIPGSPPGSNIVNYMVRPYLGPDAALPANHPMNLQKNQAVKRRDGSTFTRPIQRHLISTDPFFQRAFRYDPNRPPTAGVQPYFSCFGYVDPTYAPTMPPTPQQRAANTPPEARSGMSVQQLRDRGYILTVDRNGNGAYDADPDPAITDVIRPVLLVDNNGNGQFDGADGDVLLEPETTPWPWPRLVRITLSLADPTNPQVEETFQFIFDIPPPPAASQF